MARLICLLLVIALTGCHAPMPSFKPFAPLGSPRLPAPSTGSFGTPDQYYRAPAQPTTIPNNTQVDRGGRSADFAASTASANDDADLIWVSPQSASRQNTSIIAPSPQIRDLDHAPRPRPVIRASYEEPVTDGAYDDGTVIIPATAPRSSATRQASALRMDETLGGETYDIGQLPPPPSRVRARLRGLSDSEETSSAPVTASNSVGGWKAR